jgi:uncharacterized repeat protein (TIGR03803 family)
LRPSPFVLAVLALLALPSVLVSASGAQTVRSLYSFTGGNSAYPYSGPTQGRDGKLYGTTEPQNISYFGSIFRLATTGQYTELYVFDGVDGSQPEAGVTLATDGNFYGVAPSGGSASLGVLFKMTPSGQYTVLHAFEGDTDGALPAAAPIEARDGNLYGTTAGGGSDVCQYGCGTVYKYELGPGTLTILYQFDETHGEYADAPLIQATDGNLYGTTYQGGANNCGTIFKLSTSGALLWYYSFPALNGTGGGCNLFSPLVQAADGNFYGTTYSGGNVDWGTVFKLDRRSGTVTVLHKFLGTSSDVRNPVAGLVQGTDGNLYGTGQVGGRGFEGGLFQITTSGVYALLHSFPSTGGEPNGTMLQHTNGRFYGTTSGGGQYEFGSVYGLDMGLGPFITFVLPVGSAGKTAQILGQGLTGTTSVTFNGVPATSFKVASDTFMTAVVPSGATSGNVVVTTPSGPLTSNVMFRIIN